MGNQEKLNQLLLFNVGVSDWASLGALSALKSLRIFMLTQEELNQWPRLMKLVHLRIDSEKITDVTLLSRFINLTTLELDDTQITDISPLKSLKKLNYLSLPGRNIKGIELFDINILKFPESKLDDSKSTGLLV